MRAQQKKHTLPCAGERQTPQHSEAKHLDPGTLPTDTGTTVQIKSVDGSATTSPSVCYRLVQLGTV